MINKHRISFSHVRLYAYFLNWRNSTETSHLRETKPAPKRRLSAKYLPLLFGGGGGTFALTSFCFKFWALLKATIGGFGNTFFK